MPSNTAPRMSDEAVQSKTGKTWEEWFGLLDKAGGRKMNHREIVACLSESHGVGPWWRQMVTVTYEQARGLREKHQKPEGYEISRSKTFAVPADELYRAWSDKRSRARWLDAAITIRKATPDRSLRITWSDGTSVEVMLYPRGDAKTQVTVQHCKLSDAAAGERMKAYWAERLETLGRVVEARTPSRSGRSCDSAPPFSKAGAGRRIGWRR